MSEHANGGPTPGFYAVIGREPCTPRNGAPMSKPLIVSQTTVATMNSRSVALDYAREQIEHGAHRVTIEVTKADIPSEVCHVTVERHG